MSSEHPGNIPQPRAPRKRVQSQQNLDTRANQADAEQADINSIVATYLATGIVNGVPSQAPLYGDFTQASDLQTQLNRVRQAEEAYARLPSALRNASKNDPVLFLEMFDDEEGRAILEAQGMVVTDEQSELPPSPASEPEPAPVPEPAEPVNE